MTLHRDQDGLGRRDTSGTSQAVVQGDLCLFELLALAVASGGQRIDLIVGVGIVVYLNLCLLRLYGRKDEGEQESAFTDHFPQASSALRGSE